MNRKEFQFLIGTLKANMWYIIKSWLREFQFLIGTLKAKWYYDYLMSVNEVSIPYRYSKSFRVYRR